MSHSSTVMSKILNRSELPSFYNKEHILPQLRGTSSKIQSSVASVYLILALVLKEETQSNPSH